MPQKIMLLHWIQSGRPLYAYHITCGTIWHRTLWAVQKNKDGSSMHAGEAGWYVQDWRCIPM